MKPERYGQRWGSVSVKSSSDNLQRHLFNVNPAMLIVTVLLMEIFIVIIIISDNDIITNFSYR